MILTTSQAARALGVPESTIRQWVHRKKLAPRRRGTRPLTFDHAEVEAMKARIIRAQQRAVAPWIGHAGAEFDRLVAAQVRPVSRCGHAEPSRNPVDGPAFTAE